MPVPASGKAEIRPHLFAVGTTFGLLHISSFVDTK